MITATLTRPTTISPTIECDHKVYLVERIDIANLCPPRARTITLEPISRKSRARTQARRLVDHERRSRKSDSPQQGSERRGSQTSSAPSLQVVADRSVRSPAPSDVSDSSYMSAQDSASQHPSDAASPRVSDTEKTNASRASLVNPSRTITATVESMKGGCLRGDSIPVRVKVNHTKHVKSLHGVIITLYRQARVDMHPTIPVGPVEKGKEAKYEDYYPKSVTGLGGLSLSGAGSHHLFRKDLSQTIMPLIVDPMSLTAEVTGKVNMPEEAFPTISTVPGAMISFRYYVEVVLDIQGKLSSQDRNLGNFGGLASTMYQGQSADHGDSERSTVNPLGGRVIDTAAVRRDKGVVACTFEIVVGTNDSGRKKGKRKVGINGDAHEAMTQAPHEVQPGATTDNLDHNSLDQHGAYDGASWHDYGYDGQYYDASLYATQGPSSYENGNGYHVHDGYAVHHHDYAHPPPVPMPQVEDESQLSEKERIRRAEARLLPSQPPGAEEQAIEGAHEATAPYIADEQANGYFSAEASSTAMLPPPSNAHGLSSRNAAAPEPESADSARELPLPKTPDHETPGGSAARDAACDAANDDAPEYREAGPLSSDSISPHSTATVTAAQAYTEDKSELERRRLQSEASAPPPTNDDDTDGAMSPHASAPPATEVLGETDGLHGTSHDSHADASATADLPRYER